MSDPRDTNADQPDQLTPLVASWSAHNAKLDRRHRASEDTHDRLTALVAEWTAHNAAIGGRKDADPR